MAGWMFSWRKERLCEFGWVRGIGGNAWLVLLCWVKTGVDFALEGAQKGELENSTRTWTKKLDCAMFGLCENVVKILGKIPSVVLNFC